MFGDRDFISDFMVVLIAGMIAGSILTTLNGAFFLRKLSNFFKKDQLEDGEIMFVRKKNQKGYTVWANYNSVLSAFNALMTLLWGRFFKRHFLQSRSIMVISSLIIFAIGFCSLTGSYAYYYNHRNHERMLVHNSLSNEYVKQSETKREEPKEPKKELAEFLTESAKTDKVVHKREISEEFERKEYRNHKYKDDNNDEQFNIEKKYCKRHIESVIIQVKDESRNEKLEVVVKEPTTEKINRITQRLDEIIDKTVEAPSKILDNSIVVRSLGSFAR